MKLNRLAVVGDIHGSTEKLMAATKEIRDAELVQVGDFGLGFWATPAKERRALQIVEEALTARNCRLHILRGNHDDPARWKQSWRSPNNRIRCVPDYSILELAGLRCLFLGGAASLDKHHRTPGWDWFDGEEFDLQKGSLNCVSDVSVVFSHDAPASCWPPSDALGGHLEQPLQEKHPDIYVARLRSEAQRRDLQTACDILKKNNQIDWWFYGHYHKSHTDFIANTRFKLLAIGEVFELPLYR